MMIRDMSYEQYFELVRGLPGPSDQCPVVKTLELCNGRWRLQVLFALCKRPAYRFGELRKAIPGITNTMLTTTLRDLEAFGMVHREQFNEIPPHVEYSLTEKGLAIFPVFFEMAKWGEAHLGNH